MADDSVFAFVTKALKEDEPRIKWESAKVMGNIAKIFPEDLSNAIESLLVNAKSDGTVVRWASAFALGEILKLKLEYNTALLPQIEKLSDAEEDNGVKNKYLGAIKKIRKQ
jgi:HEAT repeat protein